MLCVYQGHIDWLGGQYRRAIEALRAGEALAGKAGDRATGAQALFHIGIVRMLLGEFEPAVRDMRVALEHVRDHERQGLPFRAFSQGDVLNYIARALAELGVFDAAHQAASKALAAGTRTRGRYERVLPSAAIGVVHYLQGDMAAAETWLERSVVDCREAETPLLTAVSLGYLGAVQVRAGRAADGLRTVTAAVESADQMGFLALQALRLSFLAEAHLACGNLPAALRVADRSLQLAIQTGERGSQAMPCSCAAVPKPPPGVPRRRDPSSRRRSNRLSCWGCGRWPIAASSYWRAAPLRASQTRYPMPYPMVG